MIYFLGEGGNATMEDLRNYFKSCSSIGFDTETTGFDSYTDKLLSYQLGDEVNQFVVDASIFPIELIKDILEERELIIQNAKFDLRFLYHKGIYPKSVWDTYIVECVLHKGDKTVRKSLDSITLRYFNIHLDKTIRGKIFREGFSHRVIEYCAGDVKHLGNIKTAQIVQLNKYNLGNSASLENLFVRVLTYIEYSGIYLDVNKWNVKVKQNQNDFNESLILLDNWILESKMDKYIDSQLDLFSTERRSVISWSSPKQVAELMGDLGINTKVVDEKSGELKDSVDSKVLEKQIGKSTIVPLYLNYKKCEKILSTYGESVFSKVHPVTGRIHTSFTQVMDTGRLSSGGKIGDKETINLQNIPRMPDERIEGKIYERECFTAEDGNILVNADYSGQEQVIFANWTKDKDILSFYEKDCGDMHSFIASKIFPYLKDVPLKKIKSDYKRERQIAKSAGFAVNYGGDGTTISDNLNISKEEGDAIYRAYFEAFPGVNTYFKTVTSQALKDGYILFNAISNSKCFLGIWEKYKLLEEKVHHTGFWDKYRAEKRAESILYKNELKPLVSRYFKLLGNISRMACNYPIQGSAAEVTKLACIYIFDWIMTNKYISVVKFSNCIHDEILLECPKTLADSVATAVEDCMTRAGDVYCKIVPLKAEVKICEYWNH